MGRFIGTDKFEGALTEVTFNGVFAGDNFSQIYNLDSINEYISSDLIGLREFIYLFGYHNLTLSNSKTAQKGHPWQPDSYSWGSDFTSTSDWLQLYLTSKNIKPKIIFLADPSGYLTENGELWVTGTNSAGELGQNDTVNRSSPVQIPGNWIDVDMARNSAIGVKSDGTLWSWGNDQGVGKLGHGVASVNRSSPTQIGSDTDWASVYLGSSGAYSGALKDDGRLYTWGNSSLGPLGHNDNISKSSPVQVPGTWNSFGFHSDETAYGIKSNGTLWGWGRNTNGSVGNSTNAVVYSSPVQISSDTNWSYVGHFTLAAVKSDGTLWAWSVGNGYSGDGSGVTRSSPVQVALPYLVDHTATGKDKPVRFGRAIANTGQLMVWGSQSSRRFGVDGYRATYEDSWIRSHPVQIGYEDDWNKVLGFNQEPYAISKNSPINSQNFHDKAVVLRMTFDGSNGATSATDFSNFAHSATFVDNAQLATGEKKFGTASLSLDGSGDYLSIDGANFSPGRRPWMAECWFYPDATPAGDPEFLLNAWTNGSSWAISMRSDGEIQVDATSSQVVTSGASISTGAWNHVRVWSQGVGSRMLVQVNGAYVHDGSRQNAELNALTGDFYIGGRPGGQYWDGYIDDVRVAIGGVLPYEVVSGPFGQGLEPTEALPTS